MQVANPEDQLHGRDGASAVDAVTAAKAVQFYRSSPPTGTKGLQEINTKEGK
jgi:pilus assembly protein CpaD